MVAAFVASRGTPESGDTIRLATRLTTCIPDGSGIISSKRFFMERPYSARPRRFPISRRGELTYEEHCFPCLIQDVSEKGMFIICNYDLDPDLELNVKFDLEAGLPFQARINVRHFKDGCFGAQIAEAGPQSAANWTRFLENNFSGHLRLPERRSRR